MKTPLKLAQNLQAQFAIERHPQGNVLSHYEIVKSLQILFGVEVDD